MYNYLNQIQTPEDLKELNKEELYMLAAEIRQFLVEKVSMTGGHLASNLGIVELTIALHYCFGNETDKLLWDVGHQSYPHKILTGRQEGFAQLREWGGISGFPRTAESVYDAFDMGHSSTSISAALGMAQARELTGGTNTVVAIIGDGALTGGMALEALNNAAMLKSNLIIILNDNEMSISKNVGGLSSYLNDIRITPKYTEIKDDIKGIIRRIPMIGENVVRTVSKTKDSIKQLLVPGMLFEEMGLTYVGPLDGHNTTVLIQELKKARQLKKAVILHCITKKGKGYVQAEKNPSKFHGMEPFDKDTGVALKKKDKLSYTDIFGKAMYFGAEQYPKVVAITAAMTSGTGLRRFSEKYPHRFFDVGIAEQHAVTFGAGLAAMGMKPVIAIYSSFLQRAYDQILHDVCIQRLPVVFAIDRAGIVGRDGATHQGIFDLSFLLQMPHMTIFAPKNAHELAHILRFAMNFDGPIAIRYPRGEAYTGLSEFNEPIELGKSELITKGSQVALLAVGSMVKIAEEVRNMLAKEGIEATLVNVRFVKPLDRNMIEQVASEHKLIVTLEENILCGGFGQMVTGCICENKGVRTDKAEVMCIGISDTFVEHGEHSQLLHMLGMDAESVFNQIMDRLQKK